MGSISQLGANRFISIHTSVHRIDNIQSAGGSTRFFRAIHELTPMRDAGCEAMGFSRPSLSRRSRRPQEAWRTLSSVGASMLFRWAFDGASRGLPVRFRFYDAATCTILEENFRRANFPRTHLIRQRCASGLLFPPHLRTCMQISLDPSDPSAMR